MLYDLTGQDVPWDKVHVIQVGRFALKEELAGRLRAAGHETCESSMIATRIELILIVSGAQPRPRCSASSSHRRRYFA